MARQRSESERSAIVAAAGMISAIWQALRAAVLKRGGTDADIYRLNTPEGLSLIGQFADLIVKAGRPTIQPDQPQPVATPAVVTQTAVDISDFFTPLTDEAVVAALVKKYGAADAAALVDNVRKMALDTTGFTGPTIAWRVKAGYTLKQHAAMSGPCHQDFQYLQNWDFPDEPTKDGIVFLVPRLVNGSTNKTVTEQLALLAGLRQKYSLPGHYLSGFGNVGLLAGLILAHHKATGEKIPLGGLWTRTDTCDADGDRLDLGWRGDGLICDYCGWGGHSRSGLGVLALGVETLGH